MLKNILTVLCLAFTASVQGQTAPESRPKEVSTVFSVRHPDAIERMDENPAVTRRMVNELILAFTGKKDLAGAWGSLVQPKDRVGIKVSAAGGRYFSSHPGVVEAIIEGLAAAGIPRTQIIVWDRDLNRLNAAQFNQKRGGYQLRSITGVNDYDRNAVFLAPILGKLIWGDVLFSEKQKRPFNHKVNEGDLLSSSSYIANVLSRQVTKVINVPVLSDEPSCGVAGALYNITVPNVDNWRRFLQSDHSGGESIAALYADEHVGPKVVINIMDGLIAQYANGPDGNGNYSFAHRTLYASSDPVALDATALNLIEAWRVEAKLPPIGARAEWLQTATELGLGNCESSRIQIKEIPSSK